MLAWCKADDEARNRRKVHTNLPLSLSLSQLTRERGGERGRGRERNGDRERGGEREGERERARARASEREREKERKRAKRKREKEQREREREGERGRGRERDELKLSEGCSPSLMVSIMGGVSAGVLQLGSGARAQGPEFVLSVLDGSGYQSGASLRCRAAL